MKPEQDAALGVVGYVRIDFGYQGKQFYHSWWPRGPEALNTPEFKAELEHYREYGSREDAARRLLIASDPANIRFKAHFEHRKWGDELIRYLKDRESTVEEAARDYIAHGGEEILLDFLKADILRERRRSNRLSGNMRTTPPRTL